MKKIFVVALSLMVILFLLAGCSNKSKNTVGYKNGTYEASFDKQDKNGWLGKVKIKIVNEKSINFSNRFIR